MSVAAQVWAQLGDVVSKPRRAPARDALFASNLGRDARIFDDSEVIQLLTEAVEREGNQVAFANRHGVERTVSIRF